MYSTRLLILTELEYGMLLYNLTCRYEERNIDEYLPSAPALPSDSDDAVMAWQNARNLGSPQLSSASVVTVVPRQGSTVTLTPSNPSTATLQPSTPYTPANPVSRANSLRSGVNRKHQWVQKSNFKTEVSCTALLHQGSG